MAPARCASRLSLSSLANWQAGPSPAGHRYRHRLPYWYSQRGLASVRLPCQPSNSSLEQDLYLYRVLRYHRCRLASRCFARTNTPTTRSSGARRSSALSVLLVGLYDQSNSSFVPNYSAAKSQYESDAVLVGAIDRELPSQAQVFQLPYMPFPESPPVNELWDYELLKPYLHESDLRWSYGAVKGRPAADWQADLAGEPAEALLDTVLVEGFDGIYIDRWGYPDHAAKLEGELGELLGVKPLVSPDGRKSFFSLLAYKEKTALDGEKSGQWSGQWAAVSYPQEEANGEHPTDRKESNS